MWLWGKRGMGGGKQFLVLCGAILVIGGAINVARDLGIGERRYLDPCTNTKVSERDSKRGTLEQLAYMRALAYSTSKGQADWRPSCLTGEQQASIKRADANRTLYPAGPLAAEDTAAYKGLRHSMEEREAAAAAPGVRRLCEHGGGSDCR